MSSNSELSNMVGNLVKSGSVAALDVRADGSVHLDFRQTEPVKEVANPATPAANQAKFAIAGASMPPSEQLDRGRIQKQMDALAQAGALNPEHQHAMNAVLDSHQHLQEQAGKKPVAKDAPVVGSFTAKLAAANADQYAQAQNAPTSR
jgi:hypothetical protein